jgi:hypothetical protein
LKAVSKPVEAHWQKSKFLNGLKPALKREVTRVYNRNLQFTLEQLFTEALTEESHLRPGPSNKPEYKGIDGPKPQQKKCWFCRAIGHTGDNCPKIAARKAKGTWEDRPPRGGGKK